MVGWLVDRLHVSTPNHEVLWEIYKRLNDEGRSPAKRKERHEMYRDALMRHKHNRMIYHSVMGARPGMRCKGFCIHCGDKE
jgi:hypothetical protein